MARFLIEDKQLRADILYACIDNEDPSVVAEIICAYCSEEFCDKMEKDWIDCPILNEERILVLSQAILMHKMGYYYASTSIFMCQVYGVAADIEKARRENGLMLSSEETRDVADLFDLDLSVIKKEKGRLFQSIMFTESGVVLWNAMADYLRDICLYSGKDFSDIDNQPLRNKVCHGTQLNFETKEHSLKAMLVIDMLIQLAYEISRIISHRNEATDG